MALKKAKLLPLSCFFSSCFTDMRFFKYKSYRLNNRFTIFGVIFGRFLVSFLATVFTRNNVNKSCIVL